MSPFLIDSVGYILYDVLINATSIMLGCTIVVLFYDNQDKNITNK